MSRLIRTKTDLTLSYTLPSKKLRKGKKEDVSAVTR
jgi:hypothetical protein